MGGGSRDGIKDTALNLETVDTEQMGSVIATAIENLGWAIEEALMQDHDGSKVTNPRIMFMSYPNAVSGQVSIYFWLRGPTATVSSGCALAGTALGLAAKTIQRGDADVMLVGGRSSHPTNHLSKLVCRRRVIHDE